MIRVLIVDDQELLRTGLRVPLETEDDIVVAHFVKTSTGFHPSGGATVEAVRTMARAVGGRLGVKASGGIHSADATLAMVRAGATRLGMSQTVAVLEAMREPQ
jgi:deoxyribose-phosphate aldolase